MFILPSYSEKVVSAVRFAMLGLQIVGVTLQVNIVTKLMKMFMGMTRCVKYTVSHKKVTSRTPVL